MGAPVASDSTAAMIRKLLLYEEVAEPFTVLLRREIFRVTTCALVEKGRIVDSREASLLAIAATKKTQNIAEYASKLSLFVAQKRLTIILSGNKMRAIHDK